LGKTPVVDAGEATREIRTGNLDFWLPKDAWEGLEPKRDGQGRPRPAEYQCEPHRRRISAAVLRVRP
jgi:hypothetical protein